MAKALRQILDHFRPGASVFLPGTTGEILPLAELLDADPERAAGVHFFGCFVPGMNDFDYAGLHPEARVTTFMLPRALKPSFSRGQVNLVPASYFEAAKILAAQDYDLAIAHVASPDDRGKCSLGIASDFTPLAWPRAKFRVLVVNSKMPSMPRGPRLALDDADLVVEIDAPLVTAEPASPSHQIDAIADIVARLIPDGAAIQTGIGGAPGAILSKLKDRRDLLVRSGMACDNFRTLAESGALTSDGAHQVGIAFGSVDFYEYLAECDLLQFATTLETHNAAAIAAIPRFHAVNSALEVDLFGQVNVEWQSGSLSSGVGGAVNFTRGGLASEGGRSIIAMPATAKRGSISRIVPNLKSMTVAMSRNDIDTVVTEYGVAQLRDSGMDDRAEALIAIAAPEFRDELAEEWRRMRANF